MVVGLSPREVKSLIESKEKIRLIDVRENWEYQIAKIEGAELMPLGEFINYSSKLNKNEKLIIYCHRGVRSYSACQYLVQNGFTNVINLDGGIDAWSREIDEKIRIY